VRLEAFFEGWFPSFRRTRERRMNRMGLGQSGSGAQGRTVCGFGFSCVGYDKSNASRPTNAYVTTYSFGPSIRRERAWA
jgi:hypothetical protein